MVTESLGVNEPLDVFLDLWIIIGIKNTSVLWNFYCSRINVVFLPLLFQDTIICQETPTTEFGIQTHNYWLFPSPKKRWLRKDSSFRQLLSISIGKFIQFLFGGRIPTRLFVFIVFVYKYKWTNRLSSKDFVRQMGRWNRPTWAFRARTRTVPHTPEPSLPTPRSMSENTCNKIFNRHWWVQWVEQRNFSIFVGFYRKKTTNSLTSLVWSYLPSPQARESWILPSVAELLLC